MKILDKLFEELIDFLNSTIVGVVFKVASLSYIGMIGIYWVWSKNLEISKYIIDACKSVIKILVGS